MTKKQDKAIGDYIDRFGGNCFLCGTYIEPADRVLVQSVVKMEHTRDDYTDPHVFHHYLACPTCREKGVIV